MILRVTRVRPHRSSGRTAVKRAIAALAGATLLASSLTSCVILQGPAPATPERTSVPAPSPEDEQPTHQPDGTAEDNLAYFQATLGAYAASESPIEGKPIVDALAAAGFEKANMQVSYDSTRTNLVADNIFVSVRFDDSCLVGQFVTESRELFVETADALGADKTICIIGTTRPIDW